MDEFAVYRCLGAVSANIALVDDGHQTAAQAVDRIRALLVEFKLFQLVRTTVSTHSSAAQEGPPS